MTKIPWTIKDVPIGALFKYAHDYPLQPEPSALFRIVAVAPNFHDIGDAAIIELQSNTYCFEPKFYHYYLGDFTTCICIHLHSTDNGKTWHPCYNTCD